MVMMRRLVGFWLSWSCHRAGFRFGLLSSGLSRDVFLCTKKLPTIIHTALNCYFYTFNFRNYDFQRVDVPVPEFELVELGLVALINLIMMQNVVPHLLWPSKKHFKLGDTLNFYFVFFIFYVCTNTQEELAWMRCKCWRSENQNWRKR